ncbi:MAG: hypothetical protein ACSLFN_02530 [Candidatus Limnocylindrales bacterium]
MIELLLEAERAMAFERIDRAEQLYRQVAAADPRNAIAVVGLARVASERGDDLGAYLLARRAMTMDPENDAARRLAIRLEEVLATRGEPVAEPMPPPAASAPPATPPTVEEPIASDAAPSALPPLDIPDVPRRRSVLGRLLGRD